MANKRTIKHNINTICSELFAECVAVAHYEAKANGENVEALLHTIVKMQKDYISRVSHTEPGIKASKYFKNLIEKFDTDAMEVIDQINNMH